MKKIIFFVFIFIFVIENVNADCIDGPIVSTCTCDNINYSVGWCCNGIYFDPFYSDTYTNPCDQRMLYVDVNNPGCEYKYT